MSIIRSLSHILMSGIFISGGAEAFLHPGGRVTTVAKAGIPQPEQAVELNGAVMVVGGVLLGLNIAPKLAATILIASLIPTTAVGHAFWQADSTNRKIQQTQFFKNLGLLGALLDVLAE